MILTLAWLSLGGGGCTTLSELFSSKTPYRSQQEPGEDPTETAGKGGYRTIIAGDDRYNVTYTVESKNDVRDAAIWGLYRCAEIALREDANYLVIIRGRVDSAGYEYVLKGNKTYRPENTPPTGKKGGSADYLFRIFKDKAAAEAFKRDPSVTHPLVYSSHEISNRLSPFLPK